MVAQNAANQGLKPAMTTPSSKSTLSSTNPYLAPRPASSTISYAPATVAVKPKHEEIKKPNPGRFSAPIPSPSVATSQQQSSNTSNSQGNSSSNNGGSHNSMGGSQVWPAPLTKYIERVFSDCKDEEDRVFAERELRQLISRVTADGRINIHRWDLEGDLLLPSIKRSREDELAAKVAAEKESEEERKRLAEAQSPKARKRKSRFDVREPSEKAGRSIYGPQSDEQDNEGSMRSTPKSATEMASLDKRASRFFREAVSHSQPTKNHNPLSRKPLKPIANSTAAMGGGLSDAELESLRVVGTCERLEKEFFRLTSAPDPATVRPEPILLLALNQLQEKWDARR